MTAAVLYDQEGPIVTITLNRPEALNAINRQLRQEMNEAIVRFDRDPEARRAGPTPEARLRNRELTLSLGRAVLANLAANSARR